MGGRPGTGGGVLAVGDQGAARPSPSDGADRRGLLGHGVGAAAAGIRLLLRQAALRPDRRQDASAVRDHLRAGLDYQSRLLRFLENHDEPRIAARLTADAERAAAVAIATLPGATLWHEGQFEGRRCGRRSSCAPPGRGV